MPITLSEIQWFNPASVSDSTPASNGGRPSQTSNASGVKNNLFPDTTQAQRATGVTYWRKAFILVRNAANLPLIDPKISLESPTPGDSHTLIYPGTWTDTQATRSGRPYAIGILAEPALAEATSITVTTEADFSALEDLPFQAGDTLRLDARADVTQTGLSEYVEIDDVNVDDDELTITLTAGLANGYAAGARVASVIRPSDLSASVEDLAVTGGLEYDDIAYPIVVPQIGGVYQTWTITVTDHATGALSIAGDTLGTVGTGAMGADLAPVNANGGVYFRLDSDGWGGTAATGDTLVFTTIPAGCAIWYQRVVPAGAASIAADPVDLCIEGESSS